MDEQKGVLPTRKWIATQVTATSAFAIAWVTSGAWNSTLSIALIGLISQAVISYLVPNAETPGGVPTKSEVTAEAMRPIGVRTSDMSTPAAAGSTREA